MKQIFIYALTFMAVLLPTLFFVVLGEKRERKAEKPENTPLLFRMVKPLADILESAGIGTLFRIAFRGHASALQKKLLPY